MNKKRPSAVVALSGGIDSAFTAHILKEKGWTVTGLHFILPSSPEQKKGRLQMVREVAEHLDIALYFLDLEDRFSDTVIRSFIETYTRGLTPNPCVLCNETIKFSSLLKYATEQGIEHIATGHYAVIEKDDQGKASLFRGKDKRKEQSYFLHRLHQAHLSRAVFPLGAYRKETVRQRIIEEGFPNRKAAESQEICFLPGNDYRGFIESQKGPSVQIRGEIIGPSGETLGEHLGAYRYTIGQRHGLGIASSRPYYVMEILPEKNIVKVGRKEDLYSRYVEADEFHWIEEVPNKNSKQIRVWAQIRYLHQAAPGLLQRISGNRVAFEFEEPQWALTPGQALVCYDGDRVIGGGWIIKDASKIV